RREATAPGVVGKEFVDRVEVVSVAGIQAARVFERWFGQIFGENRGTNCKPRRGFGSDTERAFEVDIVTMPADELVIINQAGTGVQRQLQSRIAECVI